MGFFDWLRPSPEARIRKARKRLETREYNEARHLVEGLESHDARAIREQALWGLVELNLEAAAAAGAMGDRELMAEHLDLARDFGASPEQLRAARREGRSVRAPARPTPSAPAPEGDDPVWSLPPDDPRLRYAQLVESWPEALQPRLLALGVDFASAVLAIDEGEPARAFEAIQPFVARDPVAHYERARAALAMGSPGLAVGELRQFGARVGHVRVGNVHTAGLLSQILGQQGDRPGALDVLEGALGVTPADVDLRFMRAGALAALERWDEAEADASEVIRRAGRVMPAWRIIATARVARGDRRGATDALEAGLAACCGNPGKCGNQLLDVEAAKMLARLYREDDREPGRVSELEAEITAAQGERLLAVLPG